MKRIGNKKVNLPPQCWSRLSPPCADGVCRARPLYYPPPGLTDTSYQPLLSMKTAPAQLTERRQRLAPDKPTPLLACPALPRLGRNVTRVGCECFFWMTSRFFTPQSGQNGSLSSPCLW